MKRDMFKRVVVAAAILFAVGTSSFPSAAAATKTDGTITGNVSGYVVETQTAYNKQILIYLQDASGNSVTCPGGGNYVIIDSGLPANDPLRVLITSALLAQRPVKIHFEIVSGACYGKHINLKRS